MARKKSAYSKRKLVSKPDLGLEPPVIQEGLSFLVRGTGWDVFPLSVAIDKAPIRPQRILQGSPVDNGFRPSPNGEFLLELTARDLKPGRHAIRVNPLCGASM